MSDVVRLTLVSHAMTDAMSAGRFPADEPLSDLGLRQLETADSIDAEFGLRGPELRARQTAELLGIAAESDTRLADLDVAAWRGISLSELDPDELSSWLTDPGATPHGGESVVELVDRVRGWMDSLTATSARVAAVTHPAVIRAAILVALDAPPKSFWRIDIAPAGRTVLHHRTPGWTLRG